MYRRRLPSSLNQFSEGKVKVDPSIKSEFDWMPKNDKYGSNKEFGSPGYNFSMSRRQRRYKVQAKGYVSNPVYINTNANQERDLRVKESVVD